MSSEYKTICDHCGEKTYYETEQSCKRTVYKYCKECHQPTSPIPCPGTLRVIDNSDLNPAFHRYYRKDIRIEVAFRSPDGSEYERKRGTIGKTTGWKPVYLLMLTRRSSGSSHTIGKHDTVEKIIS